MPISPHANVPSSNEPRSLVPQCLISPPKPKLLMRRELSARFASRRSAAVANDMENATSSSENMPLLCSFSPIMKKCDAPS